MADIISQIRNEIKSILEFKYQYKIENDSLINIDIPKDNNNGDYSTSVALKIAKGLSLAPLSISNTIKESLLSSSLPIKDIVIAGPGFINIFMKEESLASIINTVISMNDKYGYNQSGKGQKLLVEYVSANPTGDLHVGHAKAAAFGDSMTRLLKMSGYDCLREYYINDAGAQITNLANSLIARYYQACGINKELPEDGYHGKDIIDIANKIYADEKDKWVNVDEETRYKYFRKLGLETELGKIRNILKDFRVEFDVWSSEQDVRDSHKVEWVIEQLKEKGLTYELDGALWFKSTEFGDDKDRVLIKNDGLYTYLTPDIAYHLTKLERGYPKLVDLLGADHHGYIGRMKAALIAFGYPSDSLNIDIIQMIRLIENGEEVKMSKRTGKAVTLQELIDDIGVDAVRYFMTSRANDAHLDFDLSLAKSQTSDNPVYYAQYAHARICSIIKAAPEFKKQDSYVLLNNEKEIELLKHIASFEDEIALAALNRAPHKICNYIQKLAALFHSFYSVCKVNDPSNPELTNERLGLLIATKTTLKNALNVIGVSAPEKM